MNIEQIKADRETCRDEGATDDQRFWARNNRENRLTDLEDFAIEAMELLSEAMIRLHYSGDHFTDIGAVGRAEADYDVSSKIDDFLKKYTKPD